MSQKQQVFNQQALSQKMDQLSPFKQQQNQTETLSAMDTSIELIPPEMIGMNFDTIPDYLGRKNPSFENKIKCILPPTIDLEQLREISILVNKIQSIEIVHSLWIVYEKSGLGTLPVKLSIVTATTNQVNRKVWPKQVLSLVKQQQSPMPCTDEDNACSIFVKHCFHYLQFKSDQYRHELNVKVSRLQNYSRSLEHNIEKFVQQNLQSLRLETDEQIALVQYYYTDQILHRIYLDQNPKVNQIQIMKRLCKLKYNQEMTKHEVDLLEEKIHSYLPGHPFDRSPVAKSPLIDSIQDSKTRQKFYQQYKTVAEKARKEMMTISKEYAQQQKKYYQKQYDLTIDEMWKVEKMLPSDEKLTSSMWNIIKERLANTTARVECIYKFKRQQFHLQSNTH